MTLVVIWAQRYVYFSFFVLTNLSYFLDLTSCHYHTLSKPYTATVSLCSQGGNRSVSGQQHNNSSSWWQHCCATPNTTSHGTTTCEPQMQEWQTQEWQMVVTDNWQGHHTRGRTNGGDDQWQGWWTMGMMHNRDDKQWGQDNNRSPPPSLQMQDGGVCFFLSNSLLFSFS